ncbi:MAG: exonuclease SbcCD subunit D [Lachnospiraceae bacterium]|nr:exonuclease SbcCD subunit D [Lachnospiraceae bacterium]
MRFIHLSDLHIGKRVNEFSMLEDQRFILHQILEIIDEKKVEGVWIAGDVYDKTVPSAEAVQLFDDFLTELADRELPVFVISGNHDSPERIAFGARLLNSRGVYLSPVYNGKAEPVVLQDAYGEIRIYLLPFLKPAMVKHVFPEREITSYQEALEAAIEAIKGNLTAEWDRSCRNILLAHQFVTGSERSDSEECSVGGMDNVDASVFSDFDYVALGHIHKPQRAGGENIRYCGTPLKYSFSEAGHKKSVTLVDAGEKGNLTIQTEVLYPLRDLREIRGSYMELTALENYRNTNTSDYLHITLTDEEDIPDAIGRLRSIYPNIMKLDYDNLRTSQSQLVEGGAAVQQKTPLQLFQEFYQLQNNQEMSKEQEEFVQELIEKTFEGDNIA